jgi:periodic tryptophan protein 1
MCADPSSSGSFAAVSTFEAEIEIWDLDVLDALQPVATLGGHTGDAGNREPEIRSRKRRNKEGWLPGSHTDSVLSLAWNAAYRNVLASGSADKSIKACVCQQ